MIWKIPVSPIGFCPVVPKVGANIDIEDVKKELCRILPQKFSSLKKDSSIDLEFLDTHWQLTYWDLPLMIPHFNINSKFYVVLDSRKSI